MQVEEQICLNVTKREVEILTQVERENRKVIHGLKTLEEESHRNLEIETYQRTDVKLDITNTGERVNLLNNFADDIEQRLTNVNQIKNTLQKQYDETVLKIKSFKSYEDEIGKLKTCIAQLEPDKIKQIERHAIEVKNKQELCASKQCQRDNLLGQIAEFKLKLPEQNAKQEKVSGEIKEFTTEIQTARFNKEKELHKLQSLKDAQQTMSKDFAEKAACIKSSMERVDNE